MAGRGPAPKNPAARRRRNPDPVPTQVVEEDGEVRGPELPDEFEWPPATVRWWETWRTSAQATTFTPTDWEFLLDTALLHAAFWSGETGVGAELRLRVAKFGATPEDRARMRLQVGDPAVKPDVPGGKARPVPPNVARLADRRKRLAGA
jgi:hypothetical protein